MSKNEQRVFYGYQNYGPTGEYEGTKEGLTRALENEHVEPLRITNVITAGGTSRGICFGDLEQAGLLDKEYLPNVERTIRWTVLGNVIFTDEWGRLYAKGDVIDWDK